MYESLVEWLQFPVLLYTYLSKDLAGDATYAAATTILGYRVDKTETLVDANNNTIISAQQVYVRDTEVIGMKDMLAFPEAPTVKYAIKKIGAYYDGNEAAKSVSIIYL